MSKLPDITACRDSGLCFMEDTQEQRYYIREVSAPPAGGFLHDSIDYGVFKSKFLQLKVSKMLAATSAKLSKEHQETLLRPIFKRHFTH